MPPTTMPTTSAIVYPDGTYFDCPHCGAAHKMTDEAATANLPVIVGCSKFPANIKIVERVKRKD